MLGKVRAATASPFSEIPSGHQDGRQARADPRARGGATSPVPRAVLPGYSYEIDHGDSRPTPAGAIAGAYSDDDSSIAA